MSRNLRWVLDGIGHVVYALVVSHSPAEGCGYAEIIGREETYGKSAIVEFRTQGRYKVIIPEEKPVLTSDPDRHENPGEYPVGTKLIVYAGGEPGSWRARRWGVVPLLLWNDVVSVDELRLYIGSTLTDRRIEDGAPGRGYGGTLSSCEMIEGQLVLVLRYPYAYTRYGNRYEIDKREMRLTYSPEYSYRILVSYGIAVEVLELKNGWYTSNIRRIHFGG